jgi:hypothetical protein
VKIILVFLCFGCALAQAQTSSVNAIITDGDGQTWNNGKWSASLYNPSVGQAPTVGGVKLTSAQMNLSGSLDAAGHLITTMFDNNFISPQGTQWQFTLCPNANVQCSVGTTPVVGASPSLSGILSGFTSPPRFPAGSGAFGYLDGEVSLLPPPGGGYFNVTSNANRVWNGSAWGAPVATPSGSAGGALSGTYPNPLVTGAIQPSSIAATGNISTTANVIATGPPTPPANVSTQSSVQLFTGTGVNQPATAYINFTNTINNRIAYQQFGGSQLSFGFANDAFTAGLPFFTATGGQASGITGITSNSGSGSWVHTGAFSTSSTATLLDATITGNTGLPLQANIGRFLENAGTFLYDSLGPNTTTAGTHLIRGISSDGSIVTNFLSIGPSGAIFGVPASFNTIQTGSNCSSSASPAVCGSAAAGSFTIAAGATTLTVNTTAVTANSQIIMQGDESLGTKLGVTCNTTITSLIDPVVTARVAGTSFSIATSATIAVNPACFSYMIIN